MHAMHPDVHLRLAQDRVAVAHRHLLVRRPRPPGPGARVRVAQVLREVADRVEPASMRPRRA